MSPDDVIVRRLEPADDRSSFRSGDIDLDRFFQRFAGQNQFRPHLGTTWVASRSSAILGFVTVSAGHLEAGDMPDSLRRRLPAYPLPVLRLARLAVMAEVRGQGIGRVLVRAVFGLAWRMADDFGCVGVVVDAKAEAVAFYGNLGFVALGHDKGALGDRPEPTPMFIALSAIPRPAGTAPER